MCNPRHKITVRTDYFSFSSGCKLIVISRVMGPKRLKTIKHTLDDELEKIPPKVTQPEDELKRSFFVVLIKTLILWKKKNMGVYRDQLTHFDFNKDMRKIGKARYGWEFLKRKKTFLKFITTNARRKSTKASIMDRKMTTKMSFFEDEKASKKSPIIVMPKSYIGIITDAIADMAYIVSFFLVLFVISSRLRLHDDYRPYEIVIDIILFVDMILKFVTAYDNDLEKIIDHKTIAVRYLSNSFIFDFLAIVPGLWSLELVKELYPLKVLRYVKLRKFFNKADLALALLSTQITIIDKQIVKLFIQIAKAILTLLLWIHVFSWLYILIEYPENEESHSHFYYYVVTFYFISTTATCVGYGEIVPVSNFQIIFVMMVIMTGVSFFSYFRASIYTWTFRKSAEGLINQKKQNYALFLNKIQDARKDMDIPIEIYDRCLENLDITYKYKVSNVFREKDFIFELKPGLVHNLVLDVLKNLYVKYREFFYWEEVGFQASDRFIIKLLVSLEWQIFPPNYVIINRGEQPEYLYFVGKI